MRALFSKVVRGNEDMDDVVSESRGRTWSRNKSALYRPRMPEPGGIPGTPKSPISGDVLDAPVCGGRPAWEMIELGGDRAPGDVSPPRREESKKPLSSVKVRQVDQVYWHQAGMLTEPRRKYAERAPRYSQREQQNPTSENNKRVALPEVCVGYNILILRRPEQNTKQRTKADRKTR
jgi:hypothetical protein